MTIVDKVKLVVVRRESPDIETELGSFPSKDAAMSAFQEAIAKDDTLNIGTPVTLCATDSAPARAYTDAARRLCGADIKLTIPADKKGFFNKLFVRRAA